MRKYCIGPALDRYQFIKRPYSNFCLLQETRRTEATDAAARLTSALVDHLNVGVAQAYLNQA